MSKFFGGKRFLIKLAEADTLGVYNDEIRPRDVKYDGVRFLLLFKTPAINFELK